MKIGIIGPAWPLRGGLADFDERFARELQLQGHDVVIYSYSLQYPSFLFTGKTQYNDAPPPAGLTIHTIINSVNPLNWISVGNRIKNEKPDLLIIRYWLPFMGPALGTILRRVKKNKHTRLLALTDNVMPHEKRPGDKQFTNYFIKVVDRFATMSDEVMSDLKKLTDKPAIRAHHPLYDSYGPGIARNEALKKLNLPTDKKYLLFFGFIRKYKGLDLLLEAMADMRLRDQEDIHLIIAGEYYGDKAFYEELIASHQLESRIHLFTDFIPNNEVPVYFSAADVVMLPYRSATNSGITQVGYFFEKPMIATNVGGLPEAVPHGKVGVVCAPNPTGIASAVLHFFNSTIADLDHNLKAEKEKYSWSSFAKKLSDFGTNK